MAMGLSGRLLRRRVAGTDRNVAECVAGRPVAVVDANISHLKHRGRIFCIPPSFAEMVVTCPICWMTDGLQRGEPNLSC
jgi:hypothetical protein